MAQRPSGDANRVSARRWLACFVAAGLAILPAGQAAARSAPEGFADLADITLPAVVNVSTTQNISPDQQTQDLEEMFKEFLERREGRDTMSIKVERKPGVEAAVDVETTATFSTLLRDKLMARASVEILEPGELPRSFAKSKRVVDDRE